MWFAIISFEFISNIYILGLAMVIFGFISIMQALGLSTNPIHNLCFIVGDGNCGYGFCLQYTCFGAMMGLVISDIILLATTELKILKFGTEKRTQ